MRTSNEDHTGHAAPREAAQRPTLRAEVHGDPQRGWQFFVVGNVDLLAEPLLGLIASRECPGHVLLETLERVPAWVAESRVLVSGFHSPLEQQVLRSLLRRDGRAVKVLARGMSRYPPSPDERAALAAGRLLVLTAFPPAVQRITRDNAIARNLLVASLATNLCVPYLTDNSPLAEIARLAAPASFQ